MLQQATSISSACHFTSAMAYFAGITPALALAATSAAIATPPLFLGKDALSKSLFKGADISDAQ
jgi:hypothetical protein